MAKAPFMDNPAVVAYRQKFRITPNASLRRDIAVTVQDLVLWLRILNGWKYQVEGGKIRAKNPLAVKAMLDTYDAAIIKRDAIQQNGSGVYCEKSVSERTSRRMSEPQVPVLYAGKRL